MDDTTAAYLAAKADLRNGRPLPLMSAERRAALMLAESFEGTYPTQRRDFGITFIRRQLRDAWSWEVADQYRIPRPHRRGPAMLVRPNGKCGNCGQVLRGEQVTFCSQRCRMRFKRHGPGSAVRDCRGCKSELPASWQDAYCEDCRELRAASAHIEADDAWEPQPCAVPGCAGVAEGDGHGRPPKFCLSCGTPAARARRRRAAKKASGGKVATHKEWH